MKPTPMNVRLGLVVVDQSSGCEIHPMTMRTNSVITKPTSMVHTRANDNGNILVTVDLPLWLWDLS